MHESFWYVVVLGPTVLLMVSGLVLVWRQRSIATVLVALGFGAMLVSTLAATILSADLSVQYSAGRDLAIVSARWRGWTWLTHYPKCLTLALSGRPQALQVRGRRTKDMKPDARRSAWFHGPLERVVMQLLR